MSLLHATGQSQSQNALRFSRTLARAEDAGLLSRLRKKLGQKLRNLGYGLKMYEWRLGGKLPLQLLAVIDTTERGDRARGQALIDGHFTSTPEIAFDDQLWEQLAPATNSFAHAHQFNWIADLCAAAPQESARRLVQQQIALWCDRYTRYDKDAWAPAIIARRLINWLLAAPVVMGSTDAIYRSHVLLAISKQLRHLCRTAQDTEGADRITAGTALMLGGLLLPHGEQWLRHGENFLGETTSGLILPDGSPYDRNARTLEVMLSDISLIASACRVRDHVFPSFLQAAFDRAGPWVRMLILPDDRATSLIGLSPADLRRLRDLLSAADAHGQALLSAPHSGIQRLTAGAATLLADAGPPPAPSQSAAAPAASGALEFCDGRDRILVAMGRTDLPELHDLVRTTAAHSAPVIDNRNSNVVRDDGYIGAGVTQVSVDRQASNRDKSQTLRISHDGYVKRAGFMVERQLILAEDGLSLKGCERFAPAGRRARGGGEALLRLHLHPSIIARQKADFLLLQTQSGKFWHFTADTPLLLEESLWMRDPGHPRASQQIVIACPLASQFELNWRLERQP